MSISLLLVIGGAVFVLAVASGIVAMLSAKHEDAETPKYQYTAKKYFLTKAETEFYNALGQAVSHEFRIFAQVHLGSILNEKIKGQDFRAARAHINRKSVDFLLCDKECLSPKLAIELDDKSHEREDRKERDGEVERILKAAGIPLLRIQNSGPFNVSELADRVKSAIY